MLVGLSQLMFAAVGIPRRSCRMGQEEQYRAFAPELHTLAQRVPIRVQYASMRVVYAQIRVAPLLCLRLCAFVSNGAAFCLNILGASHVLASYKVQSASISNLQQLGMPLHSAR